MNRFVHAIVLTTPTLALAQARLQPPIEVVPELGNDIRAVADFDLDGNDDLVVAQSNPLLYPIDSFTIYYGQNDGSYVPGTPVSAFPTGYEGDFYMLAGDVTGDGIPDVVTSLREFSGSPGSGFLVYEGLGGPAGFAPPVHTVTGTPNKAILTDWDQDGTFEICELHTGIPVRGIQRWTYAGGAFAATPEVTTLTFPGGMSLGDVNGDGVEDIVMGTDDPEFLVIETLPNGDLAPIVYHATSALAGFGERHASLGDLDLDGDGDVLVTWVDHTSTTFTQVFVNDGAGGFTGNTPQSHDADPEGYSTGATHLVDWDIDGDLDAILAWNHLIQLENVGNGAFVHRGTTRVAQRPAGGGVTDGNNGVVVRDLDGDGFPDFVGSRVIKFGNGAFDFTPWFGGPIRAHRALDVDRDGDLDILDAGGDLLTNDGSGNFTDLGEQWPAAPQDHFYVQAHACGDFTGNGCEDMVATYFRADALFSNTFLGMRMLEGRESGHFVDVGMPIAAVEEIGGFGNFRFEQRDLDGDGDIDLAETNGWWENDGTGFFPIEHPGAWTGSPELAGDVDGNGTIDVITATWDGTVKSYTLQRNQGGGVFVSEPLVAAGDATGTTNSGALIDLDGDGDLDFASGSDTGGPQVLMCENAAGAFQPPISIPSSGFAWQTLVFDDFDGDGDLDMLGAPRFTPGHVGDAATLWLHDGSLGFTESQRYLVESVHGSADLDGDGDLDVYGSYSHYDGFRFDGPDAGWIRQYGVPQPGASGIGPLLGLRGPARAGETVELRFRRTPGGAPAGLALGIQETFIPNFPLPGLTLWIDPIAVMIPLTMSGPPGVPGEGFLNVSIPVQASTAGQTYFHQAFFIDGGTIAGSNGLEVRYGM